jgi:membrane fusion protein (multidrug efflux system)
LAFTGVLALLLGLAGCEQSKTPPPAPPPEIEVMAVTAEDVPVFEKWIGSLDGSANAQIRAQVSGYLVAQKYKEGGFVKKGDVLFQIDQRVFQAALDQAKAQLDVAQAQLGKTELDVQRLTPLVKHNAISQEELDDAVQANLAAKASVEAAKATAAQSQLNLDFTDVTSLIDGIAGTAQAQIGDLVGPGSGVLTTVSTLDPMRVYFSISEQSYLAFCHQFTNAVERSVYRSEMQLQLILSDGSTYPFPGTWFFTSRQVDVNTGTLQVAGLFPNPDYILRPGQYALVRAKTETRNGAILVPQRAVTELQGSYQIAVVDSQNQAHIKTVQVGEQVGNNWLIDKGIEPGDRVVVEGVQKVREGTVVVPRPYPPGAKKP